MHARPIIRLGLAGATALMATAALVPAAAASAPSAHRLVHFGSVHARSMGGGFNIDGGNWSGYAASGTGFHKVTAHWTEPSVTCNSRKDLFAPWVGIDGYGTSTVEQTGVATDCSTGHPVYQGWYEMYPAAPVYYNNPVSPGDKITATVTRNGTTYVLKLVDVTKGWTKTTRKTMAATNASAEVIMESPTGAYPNFGSVHFTGAKVDGGTLGATHPDALDASNSHGFEDHTTALVNGTSFSINYIRE
jgi:hypothetical protein